MKEGNSQWKETAPDLIPVRIDRHTVVYAKRKKVEACGGVEGYVEWFKGNRVAPPGNIYVLAELLE